MPGSLSLGLNLLTLIVFVLPGLAGVKLGLLIADRADWLNRVDTIALSFGVSLASMACIYVYYSLFAGRPLTVEGIAPVWEHLPTGIVVYVQLVAVSLAVGLLLGVLDFGGDYVAKREGLWYKFFSEIESEPDSEKYQVRVRMQSGDELWGRVEDKGEISVNRDVLLEDPRRIIRAEDGEIGETYRYTGTAYVHNQGIAHIEFDRLKTADEMGREKDSIEALLRDADSEAISADDETEDRTEPDAELEELESLASEADEDDESEGDPTDRSGR